MMRPCDNIVHYNLDSRIDASRSLVCDINELQNSAEHHEIELRASEQAREQLEMVNGPVETTVQFAIF